MPVPPRETILTALAELLCTVPHVPVLRGEVLPERIPPSGLMILRDGNPGAWRDALAVYVSLSGSTGRYPARGRGKLGGEACLTVRRAPVLLYLDLSYDGVGGVLRSRQGLLARSEPYPETRP